MKILTMKNIILFNYKQSSRIQVNIQKRKEIFGKKKGTYRKQSIFKTSEFLRVIFIIRGGST